VIGENLAWIVRLFCNSVPTHMLDFDQERIASGVAR